MEDSILFICHCLNPCWDLIAPSKSHLPSWDGMVGQVLKKYSFVVRLSRYRQGLAYREESRRARHFEYSQTVGWAWKFMFLGVQLPRSFDI